MKMPMSKSSMNDERDAWFVFPTLLSLSVFFLFFFECSVVNVVQMCSPLPKVLVSSGPSQNPISHPTKTAAQQKI